MSSRTASIRAVAAWAASWRAGIFSAARIARNASDAGTSPELNACRVSACNPTMVAFAIQVAQPTFSIHRRADPAICRARPMSSLNNAADARSSSEAPISRGTAGWSRSFART